MCIMALQEHPHRTHGFHLPAWHSHNHSTAATAPEATDAATPGALSGATAYLFAGVRLLLGFVFLWAFLDKLFGWHYATASGKGWIDGGSPTKGFLKGVSAGPLQSTFNSWAGNGVVDWFFMLGLLGIGLALIGGVALRITAVAGTAMMAFMWLAEWPLAQHTSTGAPSMSSNPLVDYHVMFAVTMIALAAVSAGTTLGLGRIWARIPIVARTPWLR
jgi:thiosulfate dehydrogenase (quinone) large subunit